MQFSKAALLAVFAATTSVIADSQISSVTCNKKSLPFTRDEAHVAIQTACNDIKLQDPGFHVLQYLDRRVKITATIYCKFYEFKPCEDIYHEIMEVCNTGKVDQVGGKKEDPNCGVFTIEGYEWKSSDDA
ncbi:predicted protein [Uncinocarpus reesii 1704]|uniref:Ecp2 effector protein domain-containing protein n=1 Tax=Uncinocarpus reesii (strain UAMH 1704) TaxID=336963 RepID=C4JL36_UNCRE|nr:uncharacterized protein UREG_00251 [Uncinocarpus reesii 1704]EEP75405.1 predicted protein [Uncinocarpus reesii 1704]